MEKKTKQKLSGKLLIKGTKRPFSMRFFVHKLLPGYTLLLFFSKISY